MKNFFFNGIVVFFFLGLISAVNASGPTDKIALTITALTTAAPTKIAIATGSIRYNVTIECRSTDMIVHVKSNRIFNGKIYAKGRSSSCVTDVTSGMEFELKLGYKDKDCDVKQEGPGKFVSKVVIQYDDDGQDVEGYFACIHPQKAEIVSGDLRFIDSNQETPIAEEPTQIAKPKILLKIATRQGSDIQMIKLGDPLSLFIEIQEPEKTMYPIFVRDLIATDGKENNQILLIDSRGCPTNLERMGPINSEDGTSKILRADFNAFKFPNSEEVKFTARVTKCLLACEPVRCDKKM